MGKKTKIFLWIISIIIFILAGFFTIGYFLLKDVNESDPRFQKLLQGVEKDEPGLVAKTSVNISLIPMYGGFEKTAEQKKADEEFTNAIIKEAGSKEVASLRVAEDAKQWLDQGDLDTAMKRYNQAWLLDNNNPEVYFGFAEILKKQGDHEGAEEMIRRAKSLQSSPASEYNKAKLKMTIMSIRLALEDWYVANKESYEKFMDNMTNVDKVNDIMLEIKSEGLEVEYNIYTIDQNYVAKVRAKEGSNFYCINFKLFLEDTNLSGIDLQPIAISGDNFTSNNNCDGKPLK